jgi:hypothetical protein
MEGVELAARFGSITNNLKYCGPNDFQKIFSDYLGDKSDSNANKLKNAISKFEAHYAYLKLIASATGRDPFDYEVCEAFWLGNDLLERVQKADIQKTLITELTGTGKMHIGRSIGLAQSLPDGVMPHHSFHVYYVKFITGKVQWNQVNADHCRVPFGKIIDVGIKDKIGSNGKGLTVEYNPIILTDKKKFAFGEPVKKTISRGINGTDFVPEAREGDWVAFHWDVACKILDGRERANLEKFQLHNINLASPRQ